MKNTHLRVPLPSAREAITRLQESKIREVANAGLAAGGDVLPFWFGEPATITPAFIREAAKQALDQGDTFYHHNLGLPLLRSTLAHYLSGLHRSVQANRVIVTGSGGVNALMLAAQALLDPNDEVVAVVPLWPNITEIPVILGAKVKRVSLHVENHRWVLDMNQLISAVTPLTKAVFVNSPNNPTGWVMTANDMETLLVHCRQTGTWIVSDEAYERLVFNGSNAAPSILDFCDANDRVIVANTFSKTWQMTGWRLGWLVVPSALVASFSKIIEFNSSCAPGFIQQAAIAAVTQGEPEVHTFVNQVITRQQLVVDYLASRNDVELGKPDGAMYVFFKMRGITDSLALAKALVRKAGIGLAPGIAFGNEGEGYLRWCIAKPETQLLEGIDRFDQYFKKLA
jgi:aspartate/methionine/tyrosine aminotransferase